jgi:large subunit ribosomal protein L25
LPDVIRVDVSALNIGDAIHVREIPLPSGVTTRVQPDLTVISVLAPTVEEEPVVAAEVAAGPEVIREKKEEPEAAGAASKEKEQKK